MYTVSIRSTLAVVLAAVAIAASPTQKDEKENAGGTNPVDFQLWLDDRKNRVEEAFWGLLIEITPLLQIREEYNKQREAATEASATRELSPHTSKFEKEQETPKKPEGDEETGRKEDTEEGAEEDNTDAEQPEEADKNEKNPTEESGKDEEKAPDGEATPKSEESEQNDGGKAATATETGGDELSGLLSILDPNAFSVNVHHTRFKVKKPSKDKSRALSSRRGLAPTKNHRAQPHSARKLMTKPSFRIW